jgi:hypothetical protein
MSGVFWTIVIVGSLIFLAPITYLLWRQQQGVKKIDVTTPVEPPIPEPQSSDTPAPAEPEEENTTAMMQRQLGVRNVFRVPMPMPRVAITPIRGKANVPEFQYQCMDCPFWTMYRDEIKQHRATKHAQEAAT